MTLRGEVMGFSTIAVLLAQPQILLRPGMLLSLISGGNPRPLSADRLMAVLWQRSFAQTFSATLKFYRRDCGRRFAHRRKTSLTIAALASSLFPHPREVQGRDEERSHSHLFSLKIQYGTIAAAIMAMTAIG